jgi:D-glycero-D-manno-heptose 1,7-bisphosphate phosphatase
MKNKAIFLDRDGTINEDISFPHKIEQCHILPGACEGLIKLQSAGYKLVIITNQSGIGRRVYSLDDFFTFNNYLLNILSQNGIIINRTYFCPHHPDDNCECRKPKTKFIQDAAKELNLDISNSWMIGDRLSDIEMGEKAGCKGTILLDSGYVKDYNKPKFKNLDEAADYILYK